MPGLDDVRRHEPVLAPLVLVAAFSLTTAVSVQPFLASALPGAAGRGFALLIWLMAVLSPLLMGGKAAVLGVLSWSFLVVLGREIRLRSLVSVLLYGEAILALQGVAIVTVLNFRGPGAVASPGDLYVPMGLDALVSTAVPVLEALARGTTPFHVAWAVFVAAGLTQVAGVRRPTAWLTVGVLWGLSQSPSVVRALTFG